MTIDQFVANIIDGACDYDFHMTWKNARENVRFFRAEHKADPDYELPAGLTVAAFRDCWNRIRGEK